MAKRRSSTRRDYLPPDDYLSIEQIERLRQTVRTEADRARHRGTMRGLVNEMLVELMLETGLRAEEVCYLQLKDLPTHHDKDVILVRRGKGEVLRTVVIKTSIRQQLYQFIKLCRKGAKPGSPLFASEAGYRVITCRVWRKGKLTTHEEHTARLTYPSLYRRIKRIARRARIPHLHPHVFRHTYATHLYAVEKDLRLTQEALGHSRPETTSRYASVLDKDRRRQIERLYVDSTRGKVQVIAP